MYNLIDKIGDWNPQLFRELKGRLKPFPVVIALVISLATQLIIFISQLQGFPNKDYLISEKYCKLHKLVTSSQNLQSCPTNQIDIQLWWQDRYESMFLSLSVIFIFTLLVAGTYLIINDLSQEERKGTLNFIRLSPQSETSIFTGKLLGVPALLYLAVIAAIPFHIVTGKLANIAFSYILLFDLILVASCIFFYSFALLFGIFGGSVFSGFKPWLGSGLVFLFLWMSIQVFRNSSYQNFAAFATLFSPTNITGYFFPNFLNSKASGLQKLQFFNFAVGKSLIGVIALHLSNYALWTYWAWQGLKRCFRNPNATIFSKQQSYFLVAIFNLINLGFFISIEYKHSNHLFYELVYFYNVSNLLLFVGLFAILLPHRQAIQDWARFRYKIPNSRASSNLLSDLIYGQKSPAILAIAINLLITASNSIVFILDAKLEISDNFYQMAGLSGVLLFISSTMIYATIAQIMLMLKNSKRALWAMGTTGAAIILPTLILSILSVPAPNILWLFTSGFWYGVYNHTISISTVLSVFLCQLIIVALLNWYLVKQVKSAGESATKALFSQSKV